MSEPIERIRATIANASGATQKSLTEWEWDVSGFCENPKRVERIGRPTPRHGTKSVVIDGRTTEVTLHLSIRGGVRSGETSGGF